MARIIPGEREGGEPRLWPRFRGRIPGWLKLFYTTWPIGAVVIYGMSGQWTVILWFSNVVLIGVAVAMWLESRVLAGMMALAAILPELGWTVDVVGGLILGEPPLGQVWYMFDPAYPLFLRVLSLYHLVLPWLTLWLVARLGYSRRSFPLQTLLAWVVMLLSYYLSGPGQNINRVHGLWPEWQEALPGPVNLILMMLGMPLLIYLPTHLLLDSLFGRGRGRPRGEGDARAGRSEA